MRFVFLTLGYHPDLDGGAYRYATEIAERLAARGHEVHAVFPNPRNSLPSKEVRQGVQLHRIPDGTGSFIANWRSENAAAKAVLDELLAPGHAATLLVSHHAYFEGAARGRSTVFLFHGPWGLEYTFSQQARPRGILRRLLDPWISRQLNRTEGHALAASPQVFVASQYIQRQLPIWHPRVDSPVRVISAGANFTQFTPPANRSATRSRWHLGPAEFLFLTVRRLDPRMGLAPLIEAFASASSRHPNARLWLAGRGPQQQELQSLIDSRQLQGRVKLLGFVPEADLADLYASADLTLMPSLDLEGFGLATVESLACGTPVLASDAGANPELVGPLDNSLIYPTGDMESLRSRLERILDGKLPLPPRTRCAEYVRAEFQWDRPVHAFEGAFDHHAKGGQTR